MRLDYWGNPVVNRVVLHSHRQPTAPWLRAGWWAEFTSAGGFPNIRGGGGWLHPRQSCRTRAEALAVLAEALAEVAADRARYIAEGYVLPDSTQDERIAAAAVRMAARRAEYAAALADPNVMPWDLPPKPPEPSPPRDPNRWINRKSPDSLTYEHGEEGVMVVWHSACVNRIGRLRRIEVGPFTDETAARKWTAYRFQGVIA